MFRLLGFIIGSIMSIGALVLLVGMPDFHLTDSASSEDRYDIAIQQLREKQQAITDALDATPLEDVVETVVETVKEPQSNDSAANEQFDATPPDQRAANLAGPTEHELFAGDSTLIPDKQPLDDVPPDPPAIGSEPEWQAFWNPFRSEIAANGFVRRLESVTGLDYRVVKIKNGVYEVAFSYSNDTERDTRLSQIAAATGLDVSDSRP